MKKRIRFVVLSFIVFFLVFVYAHISKNNPIYDKNVDSSSYNNTNIYDVDEIRQRFICKENKLDALNIKSRVVGDPTDVEIAYSLIDVEKNREIANGRVKGDTFKDGKFTELDFEGISGCKDKEYEIYLSSIGGNGNNAVDFYYSSQQNENSSFYIDNQKLEGTLILKTVSERFDVETFCILIIFIIYVVIFMRFLYKLFE